MPENSEEQYNPNPEQVGPGYNGAYSPGVIQALF